MNPCFLEYFGGRGDGVFDNSSAFKQVLQSIAEKGEGHVVVSSGVWKTGPITLPSNCIFEITEGATISFIADFDRYPPVATRWEGIECYAMQPCIQARDAHNVLITGCGTIDGNGSTWWKYRESIRSNDSREPLLAIEKTLANLNPSYHKQPGGGGGRQSQFLAPPTIQLYRCTDCTIRDINVVDSPFWTIHPIYCRNLLIQHVTVKNPYDAPNTDGLDIDSCQDVRIFDCLFDVGDDAIALKSGSGLDGLKVGLPTKDITIARCTVKRAHGGVVVGSETAGGITNVTCSDCTFIETDRGIRIKTRRGRCGLIENLRFTHNVMHRTLCPIAINMYYRCGVLPEEGHIPFALHPVSKEDTTPIIRNIVVEDLVATGCRASAGFFVGLPESPIVNLSLINCVIDTNGEEKVSPQESEMYAGLPHVEGEGIRLRHCQQVKVESLEITGPDQPFLVEEGVVFS